MSDTSESDDGSSANWNRRRGNNKNNRKIVMRIEFDDSDETSASSGSSDDDPIRPSGSRQRPNRGLKRLLSSDDEQEEGGDSSSGNKITRKVVVRGRRMKRSVIVEDDPTDEPSTTVSIERTINPAASEAQSASTAAGTEDAGFGSDSSNDEALEKCPICLLSLRNQEIGRPSICDHLFCAICIEEWAKNVTTCPIDRHAFDSIVVQESFNNRKFVREINVEPPKGAETAATSTADDGLTFCQVCNLSNREEVMLLCDGCNQGYHMDCLNPPLLEIPEGFWYCDCCFESEEEDVQEDLNLLYEDLREMGVPETRLRIREVRQPRIPRTRQSERIRASIVARTRTSSSRITSEINISQPGSSSRVTTTTTRTSRTSRTPVTRKRRTKVTRKRRKKRQRRTYVVEYDVDNYDEKFQIKTSKKYVRKRKTRKRRRAAAPTNDFVALRAMRSSASALTNETFSLFGSSNGLDYFPDDESDNNQQNGENSDAGLGSGGGASVQTSIRIRGFGPGSSLTRRKRIIRDLDQPRQVDILSSIMDMQDRFHNATRQNHIESVGIGTDGSLILPETPDKARTPKKTEDGEKQVPAKDINQAPMYPRGGNHNYSNSGGGGGGGGGGYNNRFNSQSNYRNSTGSSNSGGQFQGNSSGGGGGAGGSGGGGGGGGSGGFLFNAFRRDNNNFQSDNNFTPTRNNNNNSDNSSPNLRGRFRQNQQNQQRRNQNRYSGPPALQNQQQQNNTNLNRCLIEPPTIPFNMFDNMGPPPASFGGPMQQPPPASFGGSMQQPPPQLHQVPPLHQQPPPLHQQPPPQQPPPLLHPIPPPRIQFNFNPTNTTDSLALPGGPLSTNFMMNSSNISPASSNNSNALISIPIQALPPPPQLPVYGPINFSGPDPPYEEPQIPTVSSITVPPLAPPPWNKNLFRLTSDYGDDDDDADCPNFSVYSAESFQVARSSENVVDETSGGGASVAASQNQTADSEKAQQQEDEFEEKEEDLVQLGDDDDIPDAIESGNNNNSKEADESDIYEPENPTDEAVEGNDSETEEDVDGENKNEESHSPEKKEEEKSEKSEKSDDEDDNEEEQEEEPEEGHVEQILVQEPENESTEKIENDDEDDEDSETTPDQKITTGVKKSHNKKGVLELYDDSDWEEWNIEKTESIPMPPEPQVKATSPIKEDDIKTPDDDDVKTPEPAEKIQTDSVSEEEGEERSYTPCLDEKTEHDEINDENGDRAKSKSKSVDPDKTEGEDRNDHSTAVIDGIETELISEEDEEMFNQDQNRAGGSSNKRDDRRKIEHGGNKRVRKEQFKKISKSTKGRNYRDKDNRMRSRKRSRSRSRSNDKENRHRQRNDKRRNNKRKDIERYDVRNVIGQPRSVKDRYGRDTSRPPRSKTRSKSRSPRRPRTKSRTPSASSKNERRSFSMSPTPVSLIRPSPRRRIFSPRRSRSRRRSRSFRRSPIIRRRSRTPLRLRSRSNSGVRQNGRRNQPPRLRRRSMSHSISRSRTPRLPSPRKQRSRSLSRPKNKPKRPKDRKKKRLKKRAASLSPLSPPPPKRMQRSTDRLGGMRKKKRQARTKSPVERTWSQTPDPAPISAAPNESWTPPLVGNNSNNLTVILKNKELAAANKRKRDKKKRAERRREQNNRKEKRKQRSENRESPIAPSKEVFTSGDNILVSVSFNKEGNMAPQQQTTVVTLPPTREEIVSKRRTPERPVRKQRKPKEKSQRRHKKTDAKPVAIIDLDRSPFQVINESPRDIIVLTDSDREEEEDDSNKRKNNNNSEGEPNEHITNDMQLDSIEKNANIERPETIEEESFEMQQLGPKTPPEPPTIKFSLAKTKQIKSRNPLHDEQEELQDEAAEEEQADSDAKAANKIGPNTPPESGPCSPDAYDPFDPTKSPSASPSQSTPPPQSDMPEDSTEKESHATESNAIEVRTVTNIQEKTMNPVELVMALMTSKANKSQEMLNLSAESAASYSMSKSDASESLDISDDNVAIPKSITVLSNVLLASGKSQQRSTSIMTTSPPISKSQSQNQIKLPLPKVTTTSRQNGGTGGSSDDIGGGGMNEIESPYSPGSDDYDDLFEPPVDNSMSLAQMARNRAGRSKKAEMFDNLFGSSSPVGQGRNYRKKGGNRSNKKASVKAGKKLDDDQIKIFDEVPSSAVDLQVKDKFLRKLNRQERVVEEVKLVLKPHYNKKRITKDDYKDILRRAVPKICHSRSGEINPNKIKNLIEAYVKKFRQRNKLGIMGTGQVSSAVKCAAYLKKL